MRKIHCYLGKQSLQCVLIEVSCLQISTSIRWSMCYFKIRDVFLVLSKFNLPFGSKMSFTKN